MLWKYYTWCCVWKLWNICEIISLGRLIRYQIYISKIFHELFEKVLHELKWAVAVLESLNHMEFHQVGCSAWKSEKENWLKDKQPSSLSLQKYFVEFCLWTVPSTLQDCESLFCPYPWVGACVNKHFLQNLALLVLSSTSCILCCKSDRVLLLWLTALLEVMEESAAITRILLFETLIV